MINFVCLYYIKTTNYAQLYIEFLVNPTWQTLHCITHIKHPTEHIAHCSLYTTLYSNQNTKY